MRQAIHIFGKDVRALWPQILLVLALTVAAPLPRTENALLTTALAMARWYLIVCVVHQEKLVGNRQFWVTRPYGWKALLAAKALFVVVFVHLTALAVDVAILTWQGLPLAPALGNLWMRQAGLVLVWQYVLPAMALAAVTGGLVSFALAALGWAAVVFVVNAWIEPSGARWGPVLWVLLVLEMMVMAVTSAAVVVWQYGRRRTLAARAVLCGAMAVCIALWTSPPSGWAVGVQTRVLRAPGDVEGIRLAFGNEAAIGAMHDTLELEVRIDGIPEGMGVEPEMARLEFAPQDGSRWDSGWRPTYDGWEWLVRPFAKVSITAPRAVLEKARSREIAMRLSVTMLVLGLERTQWTNLQHGDVAVDGVGICTLRDQVVRTMSCRNGVPPEEVISVPLGAYSFTRPMWWPYRVHMAASPVWQATAVLPPYWNGEVAFKMRKPVAHLRRELAIEKIRLANDR
jgi:hypothetical protein